MKKTSYLSMVSYCQKKRNDTFHSTELNPLVRAALFETATYRGKVQDFPVLFAIHFAGDGEYQVYVEYASGVDTMLTYELHDHDGRTIARLIDHILRPFGSRTKEPTQVPLRHEGLSVYLWDTATGRRS